METRNEIPLPAPSWYSPSVCHKDAFLHHYGFVINDERRREKREEDDDTSPFFLSSCPSVFLERIECEKEEEEAEGEQNLLSIFYRLSQRGGCVVPSVQREQSDNIPNFEFRSQRKIVYKECLPKTMTGWGVWLGRYTCYNETRASLSVPQCGWKPHAEDMAIRGTEGYASYVRIPILSFITVPGAKAWPSDPSVTVRKRPNKNKKNGFGLRNQR